MLVAVGAHLQFPVNALSRIQHGGGVRPLVGVDSNDEHLNLLVAPRWDHHGGQS